MNCKKVEILEKENAELRKEYRALRSSNPDPIVRQMARKIIDSIEANFPDYDPADVLLEAAYQIRQEKQLLRLQESFLRSPS